MNPRPLSARAIAPAIVALALALLTACTPAIDTSPMPLSPAAPSPSASSPSLASPTPAGPASLPPSTPATPTSAPSPTAPIASPAPSGWRYLADFPAGAAFGVAGLTATDDGFVAVGAEPAAGEDIDGLRQGVVWTSADGTTWLRHLPTEFHAVSLDHAVLFEGELYVFGEANSCRLFDDNCIADEDDGAVAWRGDVAGGWRRVALPSLLHGASVDGVTVVGGLLAVHGHAGDEGDPTLWLSADGRSWQTVTELAGMDEISALVDTPSGMAVLGSSYDFATDMSETLAAHGTGGALSAARLPAGLTVNVIAGARGPAGLVAVGNLEPSDLPGMGGAVLLSADGLSWQLGPDEPFAGAGAADVVAVTDGLVAFSHTYLPAEELLTAAAWWSSDGNSWRPLGALEGGTYDLFSGAAAGPAGLVVFTLRVVGDERSVIHGWFAPPTIYGGD